MRQYSTVDLKKNEAGRVRNESEGQTSYGNSTTTNLCYNMCNRRCNKEAAEKTGCSALEVQPIYEYYDTVSLYFLWCEEARPNL
jgi:hypothetical protein